MYPSSAVQRPPPEDEDHLRREPRVDTNVQAPLKQYSHPSPTMGQQYHSHSPNGSALQQPGYAGFSSYPSSSAAHQALPNINQSPRHGPPTSPTGIGRPAYTPRDTTKSTYYDPTSEHREGSSSWNRHSPYPGRSPTQKFESTASFADNRVDNNGMADQKAHRSPTNSRFPQNSPTFPNLHAHPSNHHATSSLTKSPSPRSQHNHSSISHIVNGTSDRSVEPESKVTDAPPPPIKVEQTKRADPMSFSNILTSNTAEEVKPSTVATESATKETHRASKMPNGDASTIKSQTPPSSVPPRKSAKVSPPKDEKLRKETARESTRGKATKPAAVKKQLPTSKEDEKVRQAAAEIDAQEQSDLDAPGFEEFKLKSDQARAKRTKTVEDGEMGRRKRQRLIGNPKFIAILDKIVSDGKNHFRHKKEEDVIAEVQRQEVLDEKERKKEMQRKRRREKTIATETQKRDVLIQKAGQVADDEEREKLLREAHKAEKKAEFTQNQLAGADGEELVDTKKASEGGAMGSFNLADGASPESARKKQKTGMTTRPKKSKEKKQAEKDAAEAAYAAMEKDDPVAIAPKDEPGRRESLREPKDGKSKKKGDKAVAEPAPPPQTAYTSKGFHQIYEQIWKDVARKDVPKVYRIKEQSLAQKQSNLRKTAQLAGKEARRWQLRTNKSMKDVQARSKRSMREEMGFWKRNEREERDLRRVAERQEIENARKAEADREANRQKRKLNFLISQTEIFSHFVGKKVKTDEVERSTDSVDPTAPKTEQLVKTDTTTIKMPDGSVKPSDRVTNFEDLDFDAEDDTALREAAMANAYAAVQDAQDKARTFNQGGDEQMAQFDDGELNFQNPTSLGDADVSQPKMLTCQLKEYQLKGLNWLVNLYEQGINGILADEMGLGKTVQSISIMAYLAERHNIWGPTLVIAPSSTLHNWQQEIARFVPTLKVLPYWSSAKDRKVLRKFWDRKKPIYRRDSPFHVLITSYQLVVQDAQYLQKLQWQYMILDEAQAIKSSQSSRWKVLLNFHCRNRLLLTGTPIQNNMQELWALLHFIMPSLFDSHDEFSDWFSKDIESHAQSNTKLNEDQLKRLHMILKPFMLRRVKKHVQKELGDKIEKDVACHLTYRQRALYASLRNKINFMDLIDTMNDRKEDVTNLMNLVVQFRKVCNHPNLFSTAEITSPLALAHFADCAAFAREGPNPYVAYSTRALIEYDLPRLLCQPAGRIHVPGPSNSRAGFEDKYLKNLMNIWTPEYIRERSKGSEGFSWLRFADTSVGEACRAARSGIIDRAIELHDKKPHLSRMKAIYEDGEDAGFTPASALFNIVERNNRQPLADLSVDGRMSNLLNVSRSCWADTGFQSMEQCVRPAASAPPIEVSCSNQDAKAETEQTFFNMPLRQALYPLSIKQEQNLLDNNIDPALYPPHDMLPRPISDRTRYTHIQTPSMRRFVSDCGKLARLDRLLVELKAGNHRVLIYFQMTRMMDLMEEYMTYRSFKYLRLDGSTKLEDRRDRVHDFQTQPEIFIFLLSTRAGGLGINLTAADTVIFYDSDWNPTIDSQAMDRAHRLGQVRQVTVYRLITHGTVEERIRKRALQKEEVQRVVITGGSAAAGGAAGGGVDFNTRSKENKAKDIAMWLADDEQAEILEQKEREAAERGEEVATTKKKRKAAVTGGRKKEVNMDDMYHEGEGHFDDANKASGTATPANGGESDAATGPPGKGRGPRGGRGLSKKAKTAKQRLAIADGNG